VIQEYIDTTVNKPRTKLSYGTTLNVLKNYEGFKGKVISLEDINMDFYEDFIKYLQTVKREIKKKIVTVYAKNTIGGHIKEIKVFMNYANDKEYTTNQGHKHRKFQTMEETPETIYLNDNDLLTLYELDLSKNNKLDRVRDLFIIGCYTGLRFSDLSQLTPDKFIKDGEQLKIKTIKTGEMVIIPLHWTIKEILKKYNGETPRQISNQKMNEYLKELCNIEHFRETVILNKTGGGLSYEQKKQKWELVTVHTARRSFATNMFLAEVPTISIMKITGHRTEKSFMKYIKVTQEQNADKLLNKFREIIREEIAPLIESIESKRLFKLPEAAKYLKVDAGWLREQCKNGLDGAIKVGEGKKNQHYNIDVARIVKSLETRGIIIKKRRGGNSI
jgi:integrase